MKQDLQNVPSKLGFHRATKTAVTSGDRVFLNQLIGSLPPAFVLEEKSCVGVVRNNPIYAHGEWRREDLLREVGLIGLGNVEGGDPLIWRGHLDPACPVRSDFFRELPVFVKGAVTFHLPDLGVVGTPDVDSRIQEIAANVPKVEANAWEVACSQELSKNKTDMWPFSQATETLAMRRLVNRGPLNAECVGEETIKKLAVPVAAAVSYAMAETDWRDYLAGDCAAYASNLAMNLLVSSILAKNVHDRQLTPNIIERLAKTTLPKSGLIKEHFCDEMEVSVYSLDTGCAFAFSLPPGSKVSFPYIAMPVPSVRADDGVVVMGFIAKESDGACYLRACTWNEPLVNLLKAEQGLSEQLVHCAPALFSLMLVRQNELKSRREN